MKNGTINIRMTVILLAVVIAQSLEGAHGCRQALNPIPCPRMDLKHIGEFPTVRMRRLRQSPALRRLVAETTLSARQLVLPLFARPGRRIRRAVEAMPGVYQLSP